jgi:hypothetical protein
MSPAPERPDPNISRVPSQEIEARDSFEALLIPLPR